MPVKANTVCLAAGLYMHVFQSRMSARAGTPTRQR